MTAFANGAAAAFVLQASHVFALRATQTRGCQFVQPLPDILDLQLVDSLTAQIRDDMQAE
jgi:hypothetical protein